MFSGINREGRRVLKVNEAHALGMCGICGALVVVIVRCDDTQEFRRRLQQLSEKIPLCSGCEEAARKELPPEVFDVFSTLYHVTGE